MKSVLGIPPKVVEFVKHQPMDGSLSFKCAALLLYAYIDAGVLSHHGAAELLGIERDKLIEFYGKYGIPYINYNMETFAESEAKVNELYGGEHDGEHGAYQ